MSRISLRSSSLLLLAGIVFLFSAAVSAQQGPKTTNLKFEISVPAERSKTPLDGRLLLMLATNDKAEPRFQIDDSEDTQLIFGIDVDGWKSGQPAVVDGAAIGYPLDGLADVPAGTYFAQALLQKYETFHRADGFTVKLPMDQGEGRQWNRAPGNLYSTPVKIEIDPAKGGMVKIMLDKEIEKIEPPKDTKYIKHFKIRSERLSKFWGRPMELGACLLIPEGFDTHPEARYPLCVFHGHFPDTFGGFRETPPDPNLKPVYNKRFNLEGYNKIEQEQAHQFYKEWTGPNFPRMVILEIQHANPFYDDSYAVNSANLGPYGDAIMYELIPEVEKRYRCIGQGWSRFLYGGSTGGWEALAVQMFYPDEFNGCFAACPDPIDFRAYTSFNLYDETNAYFIDSKFKTVPRPGHRNYLGHVSTTIQQMNRLELVLGEKGRSGGQWDIWQAVYSPVGPDGYPKPIFDKRTGVIDKQVAAYWRENYDLTHILKRDWKKIGPKLRGKIRIYCGDMDNFYLNNAVYLAEDFLKLTNDPPYEGEVAYGDRAEHCWNGDPTRPNALSRLRYNQMYVPTILERIAKTAPPGADLKSWRY